MKKIFIIILLCVVVLMPLETFAKDPLQYGSPGFDDAYHWGNPGIITNYVGTHQWQGSYESFCKVILQTYSPMVFMGVKKNKWMEVYGLKEGQVLTPGTYTFVVKSKATSNDTNDEFVAYNKWTDYMRCALPFRMGNNNATWDSAWQLAFFDRGYGDAGNAIINALEVIACVEAGVAIELATAGTGSVLEGAITPEICGAFDLAGDDGISEAIEAGSEFYTEASESDEEEADTPQLKKLKKLAKSSLKKLLKKAEDESIEKLICSGITGRFTWATTAFPLKGEGVGDSSFDNTLERLTDKNDKRQELILHNNSHYVYIKALKGPFWSGGYNYNFTTSNSNNAVIQVVVADHGSKGMAKINRARAVFKQKSGNILYLALPDGTAGYIEDGIWNKLIKLDNVNFTCMVEVQDLWGHNEFLLGTENGKIYWPEDYGTSPIPACESLYGSSISALLLEPGGKDNNINSKDDNLWVAYKGGRVEKCGNFFSHLQDSKYETNLYRSVTSTIKHIYITDNLAIFLAEDGKLFFTKRDESNKYLNSFGCYTKITQLYALSSGIVFIMDNVIYYISESLFPQGWTKANNIVQPNNIYISTKFNDVVYISYDDKLLMVTPQGDYHSYNIPDGTYVTSLYGHNNTLYLGTNGGNIYYLNNDNKISLSSNTILSVDDSINAVYYSSSSENMIFIYGKYKSKNFSPKNCNSEMTYSKTLKKLTSQISYEEGLEKYFETQEKADPSKKAIYQEEIQEIKTQLEFGKEELKKDLKK